MDEMRTGTRSFWALCICAMGLAGAVVGCGSDEAGICEEPGPRDAYPAAGVGVSVGSVLANHDLTSPEGEPFALGDVFADSKNRLLLVSTSAGWCTACIEEQPKLEGLRREFGDDGLFVLIALFEDDQFEAATPRLATQWRTKYGLSATVAADPEFVFGAYYDRELTPMTMLVDVDEMKILRITTGFDESEVRAIIKSKLCVSD